MKTEQEIRAILSSANGTEAYHRFSPLENYPAATDGVIAVAEAAECYWLLDIIGSYQSNRGLRLDPAFQVWTLIVDKTDNSGVVRGYNDDTLIIEQNIALTDFPLNEIKLYLIDGIILLPSEY